MKGLVILLSCFLVGKCQLIGDSCSSHADCFNVKCLLNVLNHYNLRGFCVGGKCQCEDITDTLDSLCTQYCENTPSEQCSIGQELCAGFDPNIINPENTFKCKCVGDTPCRTRVDCGSCSGALQDTCVNGKCRCESCEGTCSDSTYTCPSSSYEVKGCSSGTCVCRLKRYECSSDGDCPACANPDTKRRCDTRTSPSFCTNCLSKNRCFKNSECSILECCVLSEDGVGTCKLDLEACSHGPDGMETPDCVLCGFGTG